MRRMQSLELLATVASDLQQQKIENVYPSKKNNINKTIEDDEKPEIREDEKTMSQLPLNQTFNAEEETQDLSPPDSPVISESSQEESTSTGKLIKNKRKRSKAPPGKPPYSYVALITMAITSTPQRKMTLSQINKFISEHFPYYVTCPLKWRNAIRHNLTLNDCFIKLPRDENSPETTKAHYWTVDPASETMFADGSFRRRRKRYIRDHDLEDILPSLVERTNTAGNANLMPPLFPYTPPPSPSFHQRTFGYTPPGFSVQDIVASTQTTATDVLASPYLVPTQPAPRFQTMLSTRPLHLPTYPRTLSAAIAFYQQSNPTFRIFS